MTTDELAELRRRSVRAMGILRPRDGEEIFIPQEDMLALWASALDVRPLYFEVVRLLAGLRMIADGKHLADCPRWSSRGFLHDDIPCRCHEEMAAELLGERPRPQDVQDS